MVAECAARLLQRGSHETLAGDETSLLVLLSFLQLHKSFDATSLNVPLLRSPSVALQGELSAWRRSGWQRLQLRALLRQTLASLKPFEAPQTKLLAAAARRLELHPVAPELRAAHSQQQAAKLWEDIVDVEAALEEPPFVPAVHYVVVWLLEPSQA